MSTPRTSMVVKVVLSLVAATVFGGGLSACGSVSAGPSSPPDAMVTATVTATPFTTATVSAQIARPMPDLTATPIPDIAAMLKPLNQFTAAYGDPPAANAGRIRIPRIGVDAPIGERQAPANLDLSYIFQLGPSDVVWYDFAANPGHGGEPGGHGNAIMSAHVDYSYTVRWTYGGYYVGPGAFAALGSLEPDDGIEITFRGHTSLYSVVWIRQVPDSTDWGKVYESEVPEGDSLTLITCTGGFNPATLEYDSRTLVRARLWTEGATAPSTQASP